jgi:hypothetical protein
MTNLVPGNNLPTDIVRVLATHGPVEVATFNYEGAARVACAPFEDFVYLLVVPGGATEKALLRTTRVTVSAKAGDGSYQLRMEGRAHAGRMLNRHPMLSVIEPWCPEGVATHRLLVVSFVAEEIEYVRGEGDDARRHAGLTPAGRERPTQGRIWFAAAMSGLSGPMALLYVLACVTWFGLQGADYLGRPLALCLSLAAGVGLLGGVRLFVLAQGFLGWRELKASASDAVWLSDGFISPHQARLGGTLALFIAAASLVTIGSVWGDGLFWRVVLASGSWLLGPAWALNLAMGRPEPRR